MYADAFTDSTGVLMLTCLQAVRLESVSTQRHRYLCLVVSTGRQDTEEAVILGMISCVLVVGTKGSKTEGSGLGGGHVVHSAPNTESADMLRVVTICGTDL